MKINKTVVVGNKRDSLQNNMFTLVWFKLVYFQENGLSKAMMLHKPHLTLIYLYSKTLLSGTLTKWDTSLSGTLLAGLEFSSIIL